MKLLKEHLQIDLSHIPLLPTHDIKTLSHLISVSINHDNSIVYTTEWYRFSFNCLPFFIRREMPFSFARWYAVSFSFGSFCFLGFLLVSCCCCDSTPFILSIEKVLSVHYIYNVLRTISIILCWWGYIKLVWGLTHTISTN